MAKKAKKSAVKKTSSKSKSTVRGKSKPKTVKARAKAAKVATANKTAAKFQTTFGTSVGVSSLRVTEYKLFTEDSVRGLEDQVNYHIQKGWSPVGGVVLQPNNTFTQTMIRHAH